MDYDYDYDYERNAAHVGGLIFDSYVMVVRDM